MKKIILTYLLFNGLMFWFAVGAFGQPPVYQVDRVLQELERTDEIIDQAREAFRSTNTPMAGLPLQKAIEIQKLAWMSYKDRQFDRARELTMEAREFAKKALVSGRMIEQGETVVLSKLERAAELLERAKETMSPGTDRRLYTLYETAKDNLNRAWEFYRAQQFRPALKMANQVINTAHDILDAANLQFRQEAEFERHFDVVGDVIDKTREVVAECGSEAAQNLLDQAVNAQQLSRELASQDRFEAAVQNLQKARQMAIEASKKCDGRDDLEKRYERIKSETDKLNELIPPDNEMARKLLSQVYDQLERAKEFISRNQTEPATAALKAAQLTLNQLKSHVGTGGM
jgi:flagellin-specific chaperone FliS